MRLCLYAILAGLTCIVLLGSRPLPPARAAEAEGAVDFESDLLPIFEARCDGAFCHVGREAGGVELTDFDTLLSSVGRDYGDQVIVPFEASSSGLFDKIASEEPLFGSPMPLGDKELSEEEIALVGTWIEEGARFSASTPLRGDSDGVDGLNLSDAVYLLNHLFLGGPAPICVPVADVNADGSGDITDAVALLSFLFLGGPAPRPLVPAEAADCVPATF